jgi:hypothetical protein
VTRSMEGGASRLNRLHWQATVFAVISIAASVASLSTSLFAQDLSTKVEASPDAGARRSDLREKSALAIAITFPTPNAVIDQGTTASVPINLAIASGTALESVTITVCEAQTGTSCSNQFSPVTQLPVPPGGPYQATWIPASVSAPTSISYKYMVVASARNSAGETATTSATTFTYVYQSTRSARLLAPAHDAGYFAPASPVLWASATLLAGDSNTIDHVDFLDGSSVIGSVTTPNSTPTGYAYLWNNAPVGSHEIWVRAIDSQGRTVTTPAVSLYVVPPPGTIDVDLEQPHTGDMFGSDIPIALQAKAVASEGAIERVEFMDGATVIATTLAPPFAATWTTPSIGNHAIVARAFDDLGNAAASPPAYVQTLARPRTPLVVMTLPKQGYIAKLGETVAMSSVTESPDVAISRVDYWADGVIIGSSAAPPYPSAWASPSLGSHTMAAEIFDVMGRRTMSELVVINVTTDGKPPGGNPGPPPPVVALTSPASNSSFVEGDTVKLGANATQAGGVITRVDFKADGHVVATVGAPPWIGTWSGAVPGNHVLTGVATNNSGISATSAAVSIKVSPSPTTIVLAAPATNSRFYTGDSIGLHPATMHVTGGPARVDYYIDGALIGSSSVAPYIYDWDLDAPGTYSVTARVLDTAGNTGVSAPVLVVVSPISVRFTSPVDRATIAARTVLVEGTYDGPRNTGIVVNDAVAVNDGKGRFFVNDVSLSDPTTSITAVATSMGGSRASASITVATSAIDAFPNRVIVVGDEGIDRLSTRIAVDHPENIASWRAIDLVGGTMGPGANGTNDIATLTFNAPGLYAPTMEVTDKQGNITRKRIVLLVSSSTEVGLSRMSLVNQFFDALQRQRKSRALAALSSGKAGQFSFVYDALRDHWPEIIGTLGQVGATTYGTEDFEAAVTRNRNGQKYLYLIEGMRESDGVWRIDSF